jgi:hypothetical protein
MPGRYGFGRTRGNYIADVAQESLYEIGVEWLRKPTTEM